MVVSKKGGILPKPVKEVWQVVTSLEDVTWRSDLERIEGKSETRFTEYAKSGYVTTFTTTVWKPYKRWGFTMESDTMKGYWMGRFRQKGQNTEVEFVEYVTAKKFWMKPFVKLYLKKQQNQYFLDLKQAVLSEK